MKSSETTAKLAAALAACQAEMTNPKTTHDNPFFKSKYAPLNEIINIVRPVLAKHGLAVVQDAVGDNEGVTITTRLIHASGEWLEGEGLKLRLAKHTPQDAGSAITYGRRYTLSAMLGIASEDDDDGNQASQPPNQSEKEKRGSGGKQSDRPITPAQQKKIHAMLRELGWGRDDIAVIAYERYGVESSKELTAAQASDLIDMLQLNLDAAKGRDEVIEL